MIFEEALTNIRNGLPMCRESWDSKTEHLYIKGSCIEKKMKGTTFGLAVYSDDLLAEDWEIWVQP